MGFRFHKSFKLLSGIRLNMSKSGPSVSVGGKGLTYNFGGKRERETVGLPGTGMSYQTTTSRGSKKSVFGIIVMVLAIGYALVSSLSDGKFSLAHWTDLLSGKPAVASEETPAAQNADQDDDSDAAPAPKKHHRHRRETASPM